MRSHIILRRTRLSTKTSSVSTRALLSYSGPARYPRNDQRSTAARVTRIARRASTSSPTSQPADSARPPDRPSPPPSKEPSAPANGRGESSTAAAAPTLQVPNEQTFFWTHQSLSESESELATLPPPEVFEEVLNNVHVSLHPQAQHRAAYSTASGPPVEPTLALCCPIEGGDYVVDDTVRELARRTGSDVVVLDAVHMAAGEWGHFGQGAFYRFESCTITGVPGLIMTLFVSPFLAASLIDLPQNPLHFHSQPARPVPPPAVARDDDDDDDEFAPGSAVSPHMMLQLVVPAQVSRASGNASSKGSMVKPRTFFDMCINVQAPNEAGSPNVTPRPRLVYIRDFSTLSSSWAYLHPALLSAVRQRRQGALSRSTSPVANPTVIILGITPPIFPPSSTPSSPLGSRGMMNMLTSRSGQATPGVATSRPGKSDWGEEDHAEKAREWRLRERLRKWERGDHALQYELRKFLTGPPPAEDEASSAGQSNLVFVGGPGGGHPPLLLGSFFGGGGLRPGLQSASSNPQRVRAFCAPRS
jgi:hypothetical protein